MSVANVAHRFVLSGNVRAQYLPKNGQTEDFYCEILSKSYSFIEFEEPLIYMFRENIRRCDNKVNIYCIFTYLSPLFRAFSPTQKSNN